MYWSYSFEANSLQSFIFSTGKLRDVSGASELVADLAFEPAPGDIADLRKQDRLAEWPRKLADAAHRIVEDLGLKPSIEFFRHAGGALEIVTSGKEGEDNLQKFRDRWRIFVATEAPGLDFADGIGSSSESADEAVQNGRRALTACAPFALLGGPPAPPLSRPASRTGMPAVYDSARTRANGTCRIVTGEHVDLATTRSRWFLRDPDRRDKHVLPGLFGGFDRASDYAWPVIIDESDEPPGPDEEETSPEHALFESVDKGGMPDARRTLAVVHIDGNGIGNLFIKAQELQATKQLSEAMNAAMVLSARVAVRKVLLLKCYSDGPKKIVPARPVLLGGDDLTILVRGDLALSFAETFARAYSVLTARKLKWLRNRRGDLVGEKLKDFLQSKEGIGSDHPTVKAGIAIIGVRQPFAKAYRLAEALTGIAGADGKGQSRISLWRVTGAHIPQTGDELLAQTTRGHRSIWRPSWEVAPPGASGGGTTQALRQLVEAMASPAVGSGALRETAELWLDTPEQAAQRYERAMDQVAQENEEAANKLEEAMKLTSPGFPAKTGGGYLSLLDAHNLAALDST